MGRDSFEDARHVSIYLSKWIATEVSKLYQRIDSEKEVHHSGDLSTWLLWYQQLVCVRFTKEQLLFTF